MEAPEPHHILGLHHERGENNIHARLISDEPIKMTLVSPIKSFAAHAPLAGTTAFTYLIPPTVS